jgi:hypothetical protein
MDFIKSAIHHILLKTHLATRSLESFRVLPIYPYSADGPSERIEVLQCGTRGGGQRGSPEFSKAGGRGWQGAGGGWPTSGRGSVSSLGRGGVRTGDDPQRRTLVSAAAACRPARGGARWGGARHCSV